MHWGVHDQTIQELEDKLFSQILLSQREINSISPPNKDLETFSKDFSEALQSHRGCDFHLPSLYSGKGHGPLAQLIDGSVKFDLIGGIGPYLLGHSHPLQIRASLAAARGSILNSTNFIPTSLSVETSKLLLESAKPSKLEHCWFSGSGSMANDSALRLIWSRRGPRKRLIAFNQSFSGRTLSMQSITASDPSTSAFTIHYISFPHNQTSHAQSIKELNKLLSEYPDEFAAFHGELIQGEAGIHLPDIAGLKEVFSVLRKNEIPIWIDEVQTFARTHKLFAYHTYDVQDYVDICTIGKAFNISAVLYTKEFALKQGLGGTFQAPSASLVYASSLLRLLKQASFFEAQGRIKMLESDIRSMFEQIKNTVETKSSLRVTTRGIGTIWAFDLGGTSLDQINQLLLDLYNNGIIVWRAGRGPYCLRMLFPVTMAPEHFTEIADIFCNTLLNAKYLEK